MPDQRIVEAHIRLPRSIKLSFPSWHKLILNFKF
jgi:hypothetical protein